MKRKIFLMLSLICGALCLASIIGCATDPATGKTTFSPTEAYSITTQPVVQAASAAILPPWGSVILGGLSIAFLALAHTNGSSNTAKAIQVAENIATSALNSPAAPAPPATAEIAATVVAPPAVTTTTVAAK